MMEKLKRILVALALTLAAGAAASQDAVEVPEYDGAMLYKGYCASCHGPAGKGDGPVAPQMTVGVPDLRTIQARNDGVFPRQATEDMIDGRGMRAAHGTRDMPVWGWAFFSAESNAGEPEPEKFAAARIQALADYLESIQITE